MSSNSTADAKSHNTTNPPDLVVIAATELNRLERRFNDLSAMPDAIGTEEVYRKGETDDLMNRIYILRDFITTVQATSLAGCMVQLEQMLTIADLNFSSDNSETETKCDSLKFYRLFFSVLSFIRPLVPADLVAAVASDNSNLDPWRPYQERVAELARVAA